MQEKIKKPNRNYVVIGECVGYVIRIAELRDGDDPNWRQLHVKHQSRRCKQRPKVAFWPRWSIKEKRFVFNREAGWLNNASESEFNDLAKFLENYFDGEHA